ncbi:MAG: hypothetical protein AAB250_15755 [Bdellovibrionota bacterium]
MTPTIVVTESVAASLKDDQGATSFRHSYHEIADRHVVETDVVEQLRANISQLEDLHARLRFMMSEVSYVMKKN